MVLFMVTAVSVVVVVVVVLVGPSCLFCWFRLRRWKRSRHVCCIRLVTLFRLYLLLQRLHPRCIGLCLAFFLDECDLLRHCLVLFRSRRHFCFRTS